MRRDFSIFDVPEFHGEGSPPHGSLLDLSKAHPVFSRSKRIEAQAACLIAADREVNNGDLECFLTCEPIKVQWPIDGAPQLNVPTEAMFPDPSLDEWYERFVTIPLTYHAHSATGGLCLARPVDVTLYRYESQEKTNEVLHRIKHVPPTRHELSDTLNMDVIDKASAHRMEFRLGEATHVLVDAPIMNRFLDADPQIWNHGILAGDMSDSVDVFEFSTNEPCGSALLTNVYFEFSPLEIASWVQLNNPEAGDIQVPGGIWIGRNGTHFVIELFPRIVTSTRVLTVQPSALHYDYCAGSGKFWTDFLKKSVWTPVTGDRQVDKAFFVALATLRFCSPLKKADPFPLEEKLMGNRSRMLTIPVRAQVLRLMRLFDSKRSLYWYIPRDVLSKEALTYSGFILSTVS
jgi:hypothetical protein